MGACCSKDTTNSGIQEKLTLEEKERRREAQAKAAEDRAKNFKQGGGGENLKAKQKALEDAQKKNAEKGGQDLRWTVG
eukprot:gene759-807_t